MKTTITIKELSDTEYDLTLKRNRKPVIDAHLRFEEVKPKVNDFTTNRWNLDVFDAKQSNSDKAHIETMSVGYGVTPSWNTVFETLTATAKSL